MRQCLSCFILLFISSVSLHAQVDTSVKVSPKFFAAVSSKAGKYYKDVTVRTEKTLERLSKWEHKIKTILEKADPSAAQRLFGNNAVTFSGMLEKYKQGKIKVDGFNGRYDEYRDNITTALKYLDKVKTPADSNQQSKQGEAGLQMDKLSNQLRNSEAIQAFIKERKKELLLQFMQYAGKSKLLQKINKDSYYYTQALTNYKEVFGNPKKREEMALRVLNRLPAFKAFLKKNSILASLFGTSADPADPASLAGLQTRAQVNGLIQQQLTAGGPNALEQFQQNLQSAQSQLSQLKDKIIKKGAGSTDEIMPEGFKPNNQKTKSFKQRLEYGTNIQTQAARSYFPVTSDIGLSVGYKLNDKSIIGIGASYKIGLGKSWEDVRFTQQGAALRTFVDWKIKGNFWVSGGYEMNYKSDFNSITELKKYNAWQVSGLLGLSKSIPVKTKFFKKTKMQLLWDFMSYQQVPRAQPVVFRVGYNF